MPPDTEWVDYLKLVDTPTLPNAIESLRLRSRSDGFTDPPHISVPIETRDSIGQEPVSCDLKGPSRIPEALARESECANHHQRIRGFRLLPVQLRKTGRCPVGQ
jgi:hypothetical protein